MKCWRFTVAFLLLLLGGRLAGQVRFSADARSGCVPFIVTFSDKSSGSATAWEWDFGDGSAKSVKQNPVHTYTSAGYFSVKLKVTFSNGTTRDTTYTGYIHTSYGPVVSYTAVPDSVCPGYPVAFISSITSIEGIRRVSWDFRDGHTDTSRNPQHSYAASGWYRPVLRVTDTLGCTGTDSVSQPVYVKPKPQAAFYASDSVQCIRQIGESRTVHFVNCSQGAVGYEWDFDDGSGSGDFQPQHKFPYGDYDITLVAKAANGCNDTLVRKGHVSINLFQPAFTLSDTVLCGVPSTLTLTGTGASFYRWKLIDSAGNVQYDKMGSEYKPSIKEGGVYDLMAIFQNRYGCTDTIRQNKRIWVFDKMPEPRIIIRDTHHCNPNAVIYFYDSTEYDPKYDLGLGMTVWNFGDGTANVVGDSTSHVYGKRGKWHMRCMITTPYGCVLDPIDILVTNRQMTMHDRRCLPNPGCVPLETYMLHEQEFDSATSGIVKQEIYWGDGDTNLVFNPPGEVDHAGFLKIIESLNPAHLYKDTGHYVVFSTLTNRQGCTLTDSQNVVVGMKPACYWWYDSLGERCASEFKLKVYAADSMRWDPVKKDSVPVAGAYSDRWEWLGVQENGKYALIGEGDECTLHPTRVGYNSFALRAFHNGCSGDLIWIDSAAFLCPPKANIYPNLEPDHENAPYCHYPQILFSDTSEGGITRTWYFGEPYFDHSEPWVCDTSQRKDTLYQFHTGPYMRHGYGKPHITLVSVNDDSTGAKGYYNPCKVCHDTDYSYVRIVEVEPKLTTNSPLCQGDSLIIIDSTKCGQPLTESVWKLYRAHPNGSLESVDSNVLRHYTYIDYTDTTVQMIFDRHAIRMTEPGDYFCRMSGFIGYAKDMIIDTIHFSPVMLGVTMICPYKDSMPVLVYPKSYPDFSGPDVACAGDTVCFKDESVTPEPYEKARITQYLWNAAGRSDTNRNPCYVFTTGGNYSVSLRVTNEMGCDSAHVFKNAIHIQGVNATWTPSDSRYEVCNKSRIQLQAKVNGGGNASLQYRWVFNNGKYLFHTPKEVSGRSAVTPAFDVDSARYVYITLFVYDPVSGCTSSFTDSIFVFKPRADFCSTNPMAPCPELQVDFRDSTPSELVNIRIVKWEWYFADRDDTVYALGRTPTFIYSHPGRYDVSLVVTDAMGCTDTVTKPEYVRIEGADGYFTVDKVEGCLPLKVSFAVTLLHPADSVHLIFGDGSDRYVKVLHNGQLFNYIYTTPGKYIPSMEMISWTRDADSTLIRCVQKYVGEDTVFAVALDPFFESDTLVCTGVPCTFRNLTTEAEGRIQPSGLGAPDSVVWLYGNGAEDRSRFDGNTQYNTPGWYTVVLRVGIRGCKAEASWLLRAVGPPDLHFTHGDTTACDSVRTLFAADSLRGDETGFEWRFHDGTVEQGNPASHLYDRSGRHPCSVTVRYSAAGCTHTYYDTVGIIIHASPDAEFGILDKEGAEVTDIPDKGIRTGEEAHFTDRSQPGDTAIVFWYWSFGGGDSIVCLQSCSPEHRYMGVSGVQQVWLHIRDGYGCTDSVMHELLVTEFLSFPNVFSPNGDGINDFFVPLEVGGYFERFDMTICNRWGNVVWQRSCSGGEKGGCPDYSQEDFWWNGKTAIGADASAGVYFWVVSAMPKSGIGEIILQGSVTLVR